MLMKVGLGACVLLGMTLGAQTPSAGVAGSHTGCVTALPDDPSALVLSDASGCSLLSGKLATKRLAGRIVVLKGSLAEATAADPQTIVVEGVDSVGAACTAACKLEPPGHRGLHRKEKAGSQGGTPGL